VLTSRTCTNTWHRNMTNIGARQDKHLIILVTQYTWHITSHYTQYIIQVPYLKYSQEMKFQGTTVWTSGLNLYKINYQKNLRIVPEKLISMAEQLSLSWSAPVESKNDFVFIFNSTYSLPLNHKKATISVELIHWDTQDI
jgi:hypothetical protein